MCLFRNVNFYPQQIETSKHSKGWGKRKLASLENEPQSSKKARLEKGKSSVLK